MFIRYNIYLFTLYFTVEVGGQGGGVGDAENRGDLAPSTQVLQKGDFITTHNDQCTLIAPETELGKKLGSSLFLLYRKLPLQIMW